MPVSSLALSRTSRRFTNHLKNFELGAITVTNPSDGVYRYTFADGTSPYTWGEVVKYGPASRFGILVGHGQWDNTAAGANNLYTFNPNYLSHLAADPKADSTHFTSPATYNRLPYGRNTETTAEFASFLGDTTSGTNFLAQFHRPNTSRITSNSPVTLGQTGTNRYVEINWNQVALNETTHTTFQRHYGRTVAGNVKLVFQPFIYFDDMSTSTEFGWYFGKPRYFNATISGASLVTLQSSPPAAITTFNYPGGRVIGWTEPTTNAGNPYIYLYKWNGSGWDLIRQGFISDGNVANDSRADFNTYTVPAGDGSGYFYIYIYQYDGYYGTFSASGAASASITV